jgi:type III pantothenate kinase
VKPDVVVDIGNSRIKWGRCRSGKVDKSMASLAGDVPEEWDSQLRQWQLQGNLVWAVAGVQPRWQDQFTRWAETRGDRVQAITREHINIPIDVDEPEAVGIDRLLNALAATRLKPANALAVIISVGTAVTVDLVKEDGSFAGGTIFPGPRLMAKSLHQFTAKLPLVDTDRVDYFDPPCKNTEAAIKTGIAFAIMGGVSLLIDKMTGSLKSRTWVIMTGGGLGILADYHFGDVANTITSPTLTLEGIRIAAESLP